MTAIFVPPVDDRDRFIIAADAFWDRFTFNERAKLNVAQQHNPADSNVLQIAAAKRRLRQLDIDRDGEVKLHSNRITNFVNDMVADTILTAPRAALILTTPGTDDELPA